MLTLIQVFKEVISSAYSFIRKKSSLWCQAFEQFCQFMNILRPRVIPSLLLHDEALVKTVRFGKFRMLETLQIPAGFSMNSKWMNLCY